MPKTDSMHIKTHSLSYEPFLQTDEVGSSFWLWRVEIDSKVFSERMSPVRASDARVERSGCTACGIAGCGTDFYTVRRLGDRILWVYEDLFDSEKIRSFENLPQTFLFDTREYERVLGVGHIADLTQLTVRELRHLILCYLPLSSLALYVMPELSDDASGSNLLASVYDMFLEDGEITQLPVPPERFIEIRIGHDLPGVPECRWFIGKNKDGFCVMFAEAPRLPCWIGGEVVNAAFDIPAIAELLENDSTRP